MALNSSFFPLGKTFVGTSNANAAIAIPVNADAPANQFDIYNSGPATAYISIGDVGGNGTAAVPVIATPAYGWPLPTTTRVNRSGWQSGSYSNVTVYVATAANTIATVYVTPGEGRGP